jgi:signal transduction histidine kinase
LLKNAITHANGKTVSIDGTVHGSRYVLTVRNRGVIPKDDLPRVFDSFYRGSSEASGSGLGLFIVKEICAIYEFDVAVFNDSGHVVAKVTIPIPRH